MRTLLLISAVSLLFASGCKDVCAKRDRVINNDCGFEPAKLEEEPECEGEVEALAKCSVDHSDEFCEFLGDLEIENAYTECAREASP